MKSLRSQEGYLLVDNRHSGGALFEGAVSTCSHCQRQILRNPARTRERAFCFKCNHYICDECGAVGECRPYARTLDMLESSIRRQGAL